MNNFERVSSALAQSMLAQVGDVVRKEGGNAAEGAAMLVSAISGQLAMLGGMVSVGLKTEPGNVKHPASYANENNLLFAALLVARSLQFGGPDGGGLWLNQGPDTLADAVDDYRKLSAVPVESVVRDDILKIAAKVRDDAAGPFAEFMAKNRPGKDLH
jgi:hypothetical protein